MHMQCLVPEHVSKQSKLRASLRLAFDAHHLRPCRGFRRQGLEMSQTLTSDVLIVGGGLVGASLAMGMAGEGARIRVLDGGDTDLRAARANFGLIWVQSKGHDMPAYGRWTRQSADLWGEFAGGLSDMTGFDLRLSQKGGLSFCLGDEALDDKRNTIARLHNQHGPWSAEVSILDRPELEALLPGIRLGSRVSGASFCPQDGECDPLALLRALHVAMERDGVVMHCATRAEHVEQINGMFHVKTTKGRFEAPRLILAAGHGSKELAAMVGLDAPIRAERGQILVTERMQPFLPFAGDTIRQTGDGTVMVGATHEDAGFDLSTTADAGAGLARQATDIFPDLQHARLVRTWSGLRVLTPDGCPLYAESETHPGAALITCHSGVTLAAVHAQVLAKALLEGPLGQEFAAFGPERFRGGRDVSQAA
jgi:glycine/D-amino acid oxidase-like deaminating enzyme